MTNYMTNREWSTWKRRLTIAQKKTPHDVLEVCRAFFDREEDVALPDDWARFQRAADDATFQLQRESGSGFFARSW